MSLYAASVVGFRDGEIDSLDVDHRVFVVVASDEEHAIREALEIAETDAILEDFTYYEAKVVLLTQT